MLRVALIAIATVVSGCFSVSELDHIGAVDAGVTDAHIAGDSSVSELVEPRRACDATHPCGADALCAPDGLCLPRCDSRGACVVVASPRPIDQVWVIDGATYLKL